MQGPWDLEWTGRGTERRVVRSQCNTVSAQQPQLFCRACDLSGIWWWCHVCVPSCEWPSSLIRKCSLPWHLCPYCTRGHTLQDPPPKGSTASQNSITSWEPSVENIVICRRNISHSNQIMRFFQITWKQCWISPCSPWGRSTLPGQHLVRIITGVILCFVYMYSYILSTLSKTKANISYHHHP